LVAGAAQAVGGGHSAATLFCRAGVAACTQIVGTMREYRRVGRLREDDERNSKREKGVLSNIKWKRKIV